MARKLISFFLFLVFFQIIILTTADPIDPSKLLVATIIDPNQERIIKDSQMLFQSIRLFGGRLNEATLLACITVDKGKPFQNDSLVNVYLDMNVVVDFVPRVSQSLPGTMNKYSAFNRFDKTRYDYFLWLDADIVVFEDPLSLLEKSSGKGKISCVPEMYNYMVRFPQLNESEIFWNPLLSKFTLVDDDLIAPHGLCNTGVLFFDSISLSNFATTIQTSPIIQQIIDIYRTDRFLDSLCFVGVINIATIEVEPLDYSLNYMAFLESYIEHLELTSRQPIFAHFIANSTLECYMPPNFQSLRQCTCLYTNDEFVPSESRIILRIREKLLPLENCLIFAGINPISARFRKSTPTIATTTGTTGTPSQDSSTLPVEVMTVTAATETSLIYPTPDMKIFYEFDLVSFHLILTRSSSSSSVSPSSNNLNLTIHDISSQQMLFSKTIIFQNNQGNETFLIQFSIPKDLISEKGINSVSLNLDHISLSFSLICQAKVTANIRLFSHNYLVNQSPISLHSQLLLPEYLNRRRLIHRGVVYCCHTITGVIVVEKLIQTWGHSLIKETKSFYETPILFIIIKEIPQELEQFKGLEGLRNYFSHLCQQSPSPADCVIIHEVKDDIFSENIDSPISQHSSSSSLYRSNFISFVYFDIFDSFQMEMSLLSRWYDTLLDGGLLIGSQYLPSCLFHEYYLVHRSSLQYSQLLIKSSAIDNFSFLQRNSPLFTSSESLFTSGQHGNNPFSSLPAWYFIKHDRIFHD